DELHAEARASSEARNPGWELIGGEDGFSSRGLTAWRVFLWSALALLWLTGYRLSRLGPPPLGSVSPSAPATGGALRLVVPPRPPPTRLTKACALRVSLRTPSRRGCTRPCPRRSPQSCLCPRLLSLWQQYARAGKHLRCRRGEVVDTCRGAR